MKKGEKRELITEASITEILLGTTIICTNSFNDGSKGEKVISLLGFIVLFIGIIHSIIIYKKKNNKPMIIFLVAMGILSSATFLGLLYRLIFA